MVDVGVDKVPLGAAKPPSCRGGGVGPTSQVFNMMGELAVPSPALGYSLILHSAEGGGVEQP